MSCRVNREKQKKKLEDNAENNTAVAYAGNINSLPS